MKIRNYMNFADPEFLTTVDHLLTKTNFTQHNLDIAREYLTSFDDKEELLTRVEKQDLNMIPRTTAMGFCGSCLRLNMRCGILPMRRILQLLWAIGGSSAPALWGYWGGIHIHDDDNAQWYTERLGKPAAAAMLAESFGRGSSLRGEDLSWLHDLAARDPDALTEAVSLCHSDEGVLALHAFALHEAPDAVHSSLFAQVLERRLAVLLADFPEGIRENLIRYVLEADPETEVPRFPDAKISPSVRSAYCRFAFLAAKHDPTAKCAMKLFLALIPGNVVHSVYYGNLQQKFMEGMPMLRDLIPGGGTMLLLVMARQLRNSFELIYERAMEVCGDCLTQALSEADTSEYTVLSSHSGQSLDRRGLQRKLTKMLETRGYPLTPEAVRAYLMDTGPLNVDGNVPKDRGSSSDVMRVLYDYVKSHGWDDFSCRAVLSMTLDNESSNLSNLCFAPGWVLDETILPGMARAMLERELPAAALLGVLECGYEGGYHESFRRHLDSLAPTFFDHPRYAASLCSMQKASALGRKWAVQALGGLPDAPGAKEGILAAMADSSKLVREEAARILPMHPEWVGDYKLQLNSKKAAVRQMAAEALGKLGQREALEVALANEKNAKVADAIRAALGAEAAAPVGSAADIAANIVKGNKIKKLGWLLNEQLLPVRNADGTEADETIRNAILLSYCELGRIGRSETAGELSAGLDRQDMEKLAVQVFDIWFAAGAQAKNKWVLPFAAVYGGSTMTERLRKCIHDWPEHQRGAIACDAVMALALSEDPAAIVIVDAISRKFKFRQVKQAAALALENAAQELGITAEELADRIVPDLGFGKDGTRVFDYGKRSFTVRLTPTLELQITNDQGKTVKNLPAPGKTDDPMANDAYEAFKTMKKGIKTTVTAQRARLEAALSVLRCWDTDRWKALFVENPIMHQFAMSLVWGVYEDGRLTDTFRYMEDGTFNTVDEDEYELPGQVMIGLVHPMELDGQTLDGWKQQLEDYEIVQSIDQLSRPTYALDPEKAEQKRLEDFGGKLLNGLSLSGKLLQQGWYRGSVQDGGMFYTFYREDKGLGIGVELRFSGSAVGFDDGENVTVFDAVFYTGTVNRGSYVYDEVPEEHILSLGSVPKRYYSEILHQLTRATASSTETNENWRSEKMQ